MFFFTSTYAEGGTLSANDGEKLSERYLGWALQDLIDKDFPDAIGQTFAKIPDALQWVGSKHGYA